MSWEIPGFQFTLLAAADLSAKQYYGVYVDSSGTVSLCNATTKPDGVLQNDPELGEPANIMRDGISQAELGGNVTAGDLVTTDANGKIVTATTGKYVLGRALASGSSGERGTVLLGIGYATAA